MDKSPDAFRTISEAAGDLNLPQHVLRFWETRFPQIKPLKRGGGRRYYRPEDVELLRAIQQLLYGEGYTIKGVQRILKDKGARALIELGKAPPPLEKSLRAFDVPERDGQAEADRESPAEEAIAQTPPRAAAVMPVDFSALHEAISELAECRRILDAARAM